MLALDALFAHFHRMSSNVEIMGSLVQSPPISAIDAALDHPRSCAHACIAVHSNAVLNRLMAAET
jgi:hypothetical protein